MLSGIPFGPGSTPQRLRRRSTEPRGRVSAVPVTILRAAGFQRQARVRADSLHSGDRGFALLFPERGFRPPSALRFASFVQAVPRKAPFPLPTHRSRGSGKQAGPASPSDFRGVAQSRTMRRRARGLELFLRKELWGGTFTHGWR